MRLARQFARDESGATAALFGILCVPVMVMIGGAVDGVRWHAARQLTAEAVDAAVLTAARKMQTNPGETTAAIDSARQIYAANIAGRSALARDGIDFEISDNATAIRATGSAAVQTTLLSLIGISELKIQHPAKATFLTGLNAGTNLEVSLVLDFTGSMCDSGNECTTGVKVQGLKDAAKELVDIVVNTNQAQYTSRVALVPFTTRLRVAPNNSDGSLMEKLTNMPPTWTGMITECTGGWVGSGGSWGGENPDDNGNYTCARWSDVTVPRKIMPCVTERIYSNRWDALDDMDYTDNPPGPGKWMMAHGGDRLPYFKDSTNAEPAPSGYGTSVSGDNWNYAEYADCSEAPEENVLVPLSADKASLKAKIDGFKANGATAGPLATSFGWYMLSPKWANIWPSASEPGPYSDITATNDAGAPKLRKVAVIMTDGVYNTMRGNKGLDRDKVAQHAKTLCQKMKDEKIEIYTVGFALNELSGNDRTTAEQMLQDCGTSVRHFYSTLNVTQLRTAFRDIALRVTPIRLVQ